MLHDGLTAFVQLIPAAWQGESELLLERAVMAFSLVLLLALIGGDAAVAWLARFCREPLKSGSPELDRLHRRKDATPTMGGVFLILGISVATLAFASVRTSAVLTTLTVMWGLAAVGAVDDWIKLRTQARGLGWQAKLFAQVLVVTLAVALCYRGGGPHGAHLLRLPAGTAFSLSWGTVPWIVLVVVATSNAVNLTDGLDGLAGGCALVTALATACIACLCAVGPQRDMVIVAAALCGGLLGFLRFNRHPARVFMGNVGSLPVGGVLGMLAVMTETEWTLPLVGGVFVAEALSVIVQIGSFRLFGRRVFRCAPLHHHFEFAGWSELAIVRRFWLASLVCAACGMGLLLAADGAAENAAVENNAHELIEVARAATTAR